MRTFIYHTRLDNKSNFDKIMLLFTGVILDSQSWQIFKMSGGLVSTAASSICVEGWDVRRLGLELVSSVLTTKDMFLLHPATHLLLFVQIIYNLVEQLLHYLHMILTINIFVI